MYAMTKYLTPIRIKENLATTPQITFEVTESCCLNCTYCAYGEFYSDYGKRHKMKLKFKYVKAFLSFIKELWDQGYDTNGPAEIYISFYGGEPLMNIGLIKRTIAFIESNMSGYGKKFSYSMTTNGIFLPRHINYLVEKDFDILISLDGDEKGNSFRIFHNGKPSFNKVLKSIEYVRTYFPDYFSEKVNFNAVLNRNNSVQSIYDYIGDRFGKIPRVSEISTSGVRNDKRKAFEDIFRNMHESVEAFKPQESDFLKHPNFESVARYLQMNSPYFFLDYNELLYGKKHRKMIPTGTCLPFSKRVFITASGKILPCEKVGHQFSLGEIRDHNVEIDFNKIADTYNIFFNDISFLCSKCQYLSSCLVCIFHNGFLQNHSCRKFCTPERAKAERMAVISFLQRYPESYSYIMNNLEIL